MIRLVHFLPSLDTGGAPINVMRVIKWHKKNNAKIQHIVCSPFNNLKMQKLFLKLGTDLIEMPDIKNYLQLLRFIIKNITADVIGFFFTSMCLYLKSDS